MFDKKFHKNGQRVFKQEKDSLTYYFKTGIIKSAGNFINNNMEGEWKFYRENGDLWQVGNFTHGLKNGNWVRYDKTGKLEYNEDFANGKVLKKKTC